MPLPAAHAPGCLGQHWAPSPVLRVPRGPDQRSFCLLAPPSTRRRAGHGCHPVSTESQRICWVDSKAGALSPRLHPEATMALQGQLSPCSRPGDFQGSGSCCPSHCPEAALGGSPVPGLPHSFLAFSFLHEEGLLPPPSHWGQPTHSWLSHSCVRAASGCRSDARPGSRSGPGPWSCPGASPSASPPAWHSYIAPLEAHRAATQTDRHRQTNGALVSAAAAPCSPQPQVYPQVLTGCREYPPPIRAPNSDPPGLPVTPGAGPGHRSNLGPCSVARVHTEFRPALPSQVHEAEDTPKGRSPRRC